MQNVKCKIFLEGRAKIAQKNLSTQVIYKISKEKCCLDKCHNDNCNLLYMFWNLCLSLGQAEQLFLSYACNYM